MTRIPKPRKADRPKKRERRKRARKRRQRSPVKQRRDRLDRMWSRAIHAKGPCVLIGQEVGASPHVCKGGIQAMHGIPRGRYRTRWNLDNGFPGCASGHYYYTLNKEEWTYWLLKRWGVDKFLAMWAIANTKTPIDYDAIEAELRAAGGGE